MASKHRARASSTKPGLSRFLSVRPFTESLEDRVVPSRLEVPLLPDFDQFGDQFMTVQVYDPGDGLGERVTFGIFDTGASPVTYGFTDQALFDEFGQAIPVIPGA